MNRLEHLLVILMEECAEVAKETSKALRFGINEQRDLPTSNYERIQKEWSDLQAVIDMIGDEGFPIIACIDEMDAKRAKVEKYLKYSIECGTLNNDGH